MVTIMDMNTGKVVREPDEYGEEVLNAGWLPPQPEPSLQLIQVEHPAHSEPATILPDDVDAFLSTMYRCQE